MGKSCNCIVCRYSNGKISKEEAIRLVKVEIEAEESELKNNPNKADKWALKCNLDFDRQFLEYLENGDRRK